jgi:hypothetical protein
MGPTWPLSPSRWDKGRTEAGCCTTGQAGGGRRRRRSLAVRGVQLGCWSTDRSPPLVPNGRPQYSPPSDGIPLTDLGPKKKVTKIKMMLEFSVLSPEKILPTISKLNSKTVALLPGKGVAQKNNSMSPIGLSSSFVQKKKQRFGSGSALIFVSVIQHGYKKFLFTIFVAYYFLHHSSTTKSHKEVKKQ